MTMDGDILVPLDISLDILVPLDTAVLVIDTKDN
jgi:hypothetical protein